MEKIIQVNGKDLGLRATALTPRLYRHKLGRDIIRDMAHLKDACNKKQAAMQTKRPAEGASDEEIQAYNEMMAAAQLEIMDLEMFENLAWIMARQYDPAAIPDTPEKWLDEMDGMFDIMSILPEILDLWGMNERTVSSQKNQ